MAQIYIKEIWDELQMETDFLFFSEGVGWSHQTEFMYLLQLVLIIHDSYDL